ncbi:hypothetical protein, partial [Pseudomonas sp. FW300-N2A2]|uniref:hypothetical protein n=1 Tax=Pseudomonas sp. FW300-N2A2 TaxID=2751316 RepID=UPI001A92F0EB
WLLWGFSKVTRRKGETNSRRYRKNGYAHNPSPKPKAAEKRQTAETRCRFSGIAALPKPAKPRFTGFFELARRLLYPSYEKSGHPKVSRHEHQLR